MKQKRKWLIPVVLLVLMMVSFRLSAQLSALCPSISLRYASPLTAQQIERARAYAEKNAAPFLTFWTESSTFVTFQEHGVQAAQILYDGDPELPYPVTYRHGGPPGLDKTSCAVSTGLAWELWQADRVVGMTVEIEGTKYTVSGVFEEEACRLFRRADAGFTAVEIPDTPQGEDSYRYAQDLVAKSGLGLASGILWGSGMAGIGRALCFLPLILAACYLLVSCFAKLKKLPGIVWGVLILGAVLALPQILEAVPGWLVPTRWSDFSFYARLWDTFCQRWRELLLLNPTPMDAQRKTLFLGLLFCALGCCFLTAEFKRAFFPKRQIYKC